MPIMKNKAITPNGLLCIPTHVIARLATEGGGRSDRGRNVRGSAEPFGRGQSLSEYSDI